MQTPEKPSRLGQTSFILAILVIVLWCVYFIIFAAMSEGGMTFGMDAETAGYTVVLGGGLLMGALTVLITLAGTITGILALRKKDPKRTLAMIGLVFNFLCLVPYCLFFILLALGSFSMADITSFAP